jgi:tRNA1(Val) A37 N6-methylase TrmN6
MSSINPHYTFQYSQPEEYHFSHDSVFLARRSFEILKEQGFTGDKALDLCAGCGVVGLDFLFHCEKEEIQLVKTFDFLEVQDVYRSYFEVNCTRAGIPKESASFKLGSYAELVAKEPQYDLILSNPPYFRVGQGKMSPSEFKNRCRFFIDSDFKTLLKAMSDGLKDHGQAFFLLRDLEDHGFYAQAEAAQILEKDGMLVRLGDIRGTSFMLFKRNAR